MRALAERIAEVVRANRGEGWLYFDGSWRDWSEIAHSAAELERGDARRVGVVARNSVLSATTMAATLMTGRTIVCLDAMAADADLRAEVARTAPDVLIADDEDERGIDAAPSPGTGRIEESEDPVAVDLGTSGTTGPPKRFEMRYGQLEEALLQTRRHIYGAGQFGSPEARTSASMVHTPLSHVGGFYRLIDNLVEPRPTVLLTKFQVEEWAELVEKFGIKVDGLNPTAIQMVLAAGIDPDRLSSLRAVRCGMAPIPDETRDAFEQRYGAAVLKAYGATEFSGEVAGWTLADYRSLKTVKNGAVGRIHSGIEARVVDDEGRPLPDQTQPGLLQLKGRRIGTGEGWVTTTDMARIDADRYLWILGRADSAINRGGFKIVPEQVIDVIRSHPAVEDAAVVGVPDPRLGQVVAAAVVARAGQVVDEAGIRQWCRDRLPHFMAPEIVAVVDHLPMTRSLKVDRGTVRTLVEQEKTRRRS